jgi:hypothetical protein
MEAGLFLRHLGRAVDMTSSTATLCVLNSAVEMSARSLLGGLLAIEEALAKLDLLLTHHKSSPV